MEIAALNQKFGISESLVFSEGKGSLPVANISNSFGTCVVSLYGAHILSYQPAGNNEVLWMSEKSVFEAGKPIRGGIPVCFPWFGPHASDSQKAVHGFARLLNWDVKSTKTLADGSTQIVLSLQDSETTKVIWPYNFEATLTVTVGEKLHVSLHFINTGNEAFTCTDALHSYFKVSDIENTSISGLFESNYYDGGGTETKKQNEDLLVIEKEENRRYIGHTSDCLITDLKLARKINVSKSGSKVTVIWNPFEETAKNIGDMHEGGYKTFVCVEAVNAYQDAVTLNTGEEWTLSQTIFVS